MAFKTPKYWLWSLCMAMALLIGTTLLAACGDTPTAATTPTATTAPTTAPTVAPTPTTAPTTAPAQEVKVKIVENNEKYSFSPATITISKGTKVTWTNVSDAPHTVTSDTDAFTASSTLAKQKTFSMTFTTAGTFTYHCAIHPYMKATIIVTA